MRHASAAALVILVGILLLHWYPAGDGSQPTHESPNVDPRKSAPATLTPPISIAKPMIAPKKLITSQPSAERFEPAPLTAEQTDSLRESQDTEQGWEQSRDDFLNKELGLDQTQLSQMNQLRTATLEREKTLSDTPVSTAEENTRLITALSDNRRAYDEKISAILGKDRWVSYQKHFAKFWHHSADSSSSGLHAALK